MLFMTNVPLPSIMDPKYVTNSGQKETYRILFLSETFNPWNSLSSSDLYVFGKLFFPLLPSDTWRQSYCKVASSSRILSVCWAFVAYLRSCLKRQRGFWSRSDLSNFSVHQRERCAGGSCKILSSVQRRAVRMFNSMSLSLKMMR